MAAGSRRNASAFRGSWKENQPMKHHGFPLSPGLEEKAKLEKKRFGKKLSR
jgi:hypothetical protein